MEIQNLSKYEVIKMRNNLPNDTSYEDIQYHLYVLQKIKKGLNDLEKGRLYSNEEAKQIFSKWKSQ